MAYKFYFQNKISAAKRLLKRIIEKSPNAKAFFLYALICYQENNLAEAEWAIDEAITYEPGFYEAWILKSKILREQDKLSDALEALDRAYELQVELEEYVDYEIFILRAEIFLEIGMIDKAKRELNRAKELNPYDDDLLKLEKKIASEYQ